MLIFFIELYAGILKKLYEFQKVYFVNIIVNRSLNFSFRYLVQIKF